jgi:G3E family GTPase
MKIAQKQAFWLRKDDVLIEDAMELVPGGARSLRVNEVGELYVDFKIVESYGLRAMEMSGGCIAAR